MKSSWLISQKTYTLFLYSAWVVACMGVFMIFMPTPWFRQIEAVPTGELVLRVIGALLGIVGGPAALIVLFGMSVYCVREDDSRVGIKILWFIFFFATAPFGTAVYFFSVYRKKLASAYVLTN
jgi:hypothetical protein